MNWPPRLTQAPISLAGNPIGILAGWFGRMPLILVLAFMLFSQLGPRRPELPGAMRQSVDEQITAAMDDVAAKATATHVGRLAVLYLNRDDSDYATSEIRRQLFSRGIAIQPDRTLGEKVRDLIGIGQHPTSTVEEAIAEGKRLDLDAVIFGTLDVNGSTARLDLRFADIRSGISQPVIIPAPPAQQALTSAVSSPGQSDVELHVVRRCIIWAIVALLLPIFTVGFLREVVQKESNRRNLFALIIYTAVDVLLLWLLLESNSLTWQLGWIVVGGIAVFFYNVSIMTWALKMEG